MFSIIIIFPRMEDAENMKSLFVRNGFEVHAVCTTGAQAISVANELDGGIVVCGYRMPDMNCVEINRYLPEGFEMLLIASAAMIAELNGSGMPLKTKDLLDTLRVMAQSYIMKKRRERKKPKVRGEKERAVIEEAKLILMQRNHMTEEEAHRYLQKNSMQSGVNLLEMAQMVIGML